MDLALCALLLTGATGLLGSIHGWMLLVTDAAGAFFVPMGQARQVKSFDQSHTAQPSARPTFCSTSNGRPDSSNVKIPILKISRFDLGFFGAVRGRAAPSPMAGRATIFLSTQPLYRYQYRVWMRVCVRLFILSRLELTIKAHAIFCNGALHRTRIATHE